MEQVGRLSIKSMTTFIYTKLPRNYFCNKRSCYFARTYTAT